MNISKDFVSSVRMSRLILVLLQFLLPTISHAYPNKICRNYFVHTDLFESFSEERKIGFLALAKKYSEAIDQPHHLVREVKEHLNTELERLINLKDLDLSQFEDSRSLFLSLVVKFQGLNSEARYLRNQERLDFQESFIQQSKRHAEYKKYFPLFKIYKVENHEDLLEAIFKHYHTRDLHDVLLKSNGRHQHPTHHTPNVLEVEYLLTLSVDKNKYDWDGNNVLVYASIWGNKDIVALLIKSGVDIENLKNRDNSPLRNAVLNQRRDVVSLLLQAGAEKDLLNFNQDTVLMSAISYNRPTSYNSGGTHDGIIADLIKAGAQLDLQDKNGDTVLIKAIEQKDNRSILALLNAGASIHIANNNRQQPLAVAAAIDSTFAIVELLQRGSDVNFQDAKGFTPLMHAAAHGQWSNIQLLLKAHADPALKNLQGDTALSLAKRFKNAQKSQKRGEWRRNKKINLPILIKVTPPEPSVFRTFWNAVLKKLQTQKQP